MLLYILFFFLGLNLTFIAGNYIFNLFENKTNNTLNSLFYKLSIGIFLFIFISAIFFTWGNTILVGLTIPCLFLVNKKKISLKLRSPKLFEIISLNFAIGLPVLIFQFILHPSIGKWTLLPVDINYYSEITYYMKQGYESKYGALSSLRIPNIPTKSPYHYAELWLNCFYSSVFPKAMIGYTLLYVTYPILLSVLFSGIIGFIRNYTQKIYLIIPFAFLCLFIGPFDSFLFRELFHQGNLLNSNTVIFENSGFFFNTLPFSYHGQKHTLFYIVFLLFVLEYQRNTRNAFIILSVCPFINFGLLPGIFSGFILYFIFGYFINKSNKIKLTKAYILPILITTIFYWIFYKINAGKDIEKQVSIVLFNSQNLNIKGEIARFFYKISYSSIFLLILYFWSLPLLFLKKQVPIKLKEIFILLLGILISAIFSRIILEGFNSAQILTYLLPSVNITFSLVFIHLLFNIHSKKTQLIFFLFLFSISLNNIFWTHFHSTTRREIDIDKCYSKSFTSKCMMELKKEKNPKIGYFLTQNEASTIEAGFWYGYYPCEFIFTKDYFNVYSLNYPYFNKENGMYDYATNHMRYIFNKKTSLKKFSILIPKIIISKNIQFILIKKGAQIPKTILRIINKKYIDKKSGDSFIVVNSNSLKN